MNKDGPGTGLIEAAEPLDRFGEIPRDGFGNLTGQDFAFQA